MGQKPPIKAFQKKGLGQIFHISKNITKSHFFPGKIFVHERK
jgi:hypothetical protein